MATAKQNGVRTLLIGIAVVAAGGLGTVIWHNTSSTIGMEERVKGIEADVAGIAVIKDDISDIKADLKVILHVLGVESPIGATP